MSSGERPIGAAKDKQPNTEAFLPPPPHPQKRYVQVFGWVSRCFGGLVPRRSAHAHGDFAHTLSQGKPLTTCVCPRSPVGFAIMEGLLRVLRRSRVMGVPVGSDPVSPTPLRQGCIRTADNHKRIGGTPPPPPRLDPTRLDPDFIVRKSEIYKRKYWVGPFFVRKLLGSRPPPPPLL